MAPSHASLLQDHAQKYRRARLPGPAGPRTLAQFSFLLTRANALTQATEPMAGALLLGCILHLCTTRRPRKLAKVGLERMPFLKGETMPWSDRTSVAQQSLSQA